METEWFAERHIPTIEKGLVESRSNADNSSTDDSDDHKTEALSYLEKALSDELAELASCARKVEQIESSIETLLSESDNEPGTCPIHDAKLDGVYLPITIGHVTVIPPPNWSWSDYQEARVSDFPYSGDDVHRWTTIGEIKTVEGFECPECNTAKSKWLEAQVKSNYQNRVPETD